MCTRHMQKADVLEVIRSWPTVQSLQTGLHTEHRRRARKKVVLVDALAPVQRRASLLGLLAASGTCTCGPSSAQPLPVRWLFATLPSDYTETASKLVKALRASIEADLSDADEREVRRKADPAKELVRTWLSKWRDSSTVRGEQSYKQISGTLQQLGDFYLKKGQRARLPKDLGDSLLSKLQAADLALPRQASAA